MKAKIHPKYYDNCQVTCACGNTFTTGSTLPEIRVEVCAACHPFFTGEVKYVDTLGRVERFKQSQAASAGKTYLKKKLRRSMKKKLAEEKAKLAPKSLKDMLQATKEVKSEKLKVKSDKTEAKTPEVTEEKTNSSQKTA